MSLRRVALASLALLAIGRLPASLAAPLPRVFIQTQVTPSNPYVQAAARVIVRVFSSRALYHARLRLRGNDEIVVHRVGTDSLNRIRRSGRSYDVLTREYLVFAQHSGPVRIPAAVLKAEALMPLRGSVRYNNPSGRSLAPYGYGAPVSVMPLTLHGKVISLNVRPRPRGTLGSYWLPAEHVSLSRVWSRNATTTHVGEAFGVDLAVSAKGLPAEALPDVTAFVRPPPGLKDYPGEPKLDDSAQDDTLVGRRQQSVALIADRPGRYTLPAIHLHWWDTTDNVERTVSVPPQSIVVLPSAAAATTAAPPARSAPGPSALVLRLGDPWLWTSAVLALAWFATIGAWRASDRRARARPLGAVQAPSAAAPGVSRSRAAFFDACRANDPRAARRHLLEWTAALWPASVPRGLNDLAKRLGEPRSESLLRELDRACYAGGEWQGGALARALSTWRPEVHRAPHRSPLAPLYPSRER